MAIDYKEIGSNIKVCRIRKNLKQAQLAEIVGVSSQHISHIECGRTTVSLPLLISIAQGYLLTYMPFLMESWSLGQRPVLG